MTSSFDQAIDRIDTLLARRHTEGLGPGLSLAVTARDRLLATRTYGVANADTNEPVTEKTLFQIGSISKHFTAVACLRLVEQGLLDLHAPVRAVLDWFKVQSVFKTPVTIHHLLTHTAGIIMMNDCYPSSWWQTWALRDTELGFEPGSQFSYSNVGYNVLQCVIQTITGRSFHTSLQSLVLEPLGMTESYGEITNDLYDRLAKGHKWGPHDDRPVPCPDKQMVVNWYELSEGCGSVVTTPSDLSIFLRMLLNGGICDDGTRLLQTETYALMTQAHAVMEGFFAGTSQGYGVLIEQSDATDNHRRILGGGENLGFEASMMGDLETGVGVILINNSFDMHWNESRYAISALVCAAERRPLPDLPEDSAPKPRSLGDKASNYAGIYSSWDREFCITEENGQLVFSSNGLHQPLELIRGNNFRVPHPSFDHAMLTFGCDDEGQVVEAFHLGEWFQTNRCKEPTTYDYPEEWNAYVGQYRSFGVLVTNFRIFIRKGTLICQSFGGYAEETLTDLGDGTFRSGNETSPHRLTFDCLAGGQALRCRSSGGEFFRMQ
jgi:D-alanyl-D-alanine carboxypeptidase